MDETMRNTKDMIRMASLYFILLSKIQSVLKESRRPLKLKLAPNPYCIQSVP